MSGRWKGVFGATRALAQAAGVIASRWPSGDNEKGTPDKNLVGRTKRAPVRARKKQREWQICGRRSRDSRGRQVNPTGPERLAASFDDLLTG